MKRWYSEPGDLVEQPVDGYVIDLVRGELLIEIQTRGFSSMKAKLHALLDDHAVRVVHPIAVDRFIVKHDDDGEVLSRRCSPKHGVSVDVFAELVSFPELIAHPDFSVEVILTREEEVRVHDGERGWRRKGWVIEERRLLEVVESVVVSAPSDLGALVPSDVPERFTTADLAAAIGRPRRLAQQMTYCLRNVGELDVVGKDGRALVYARAT